MAIAVDDLLRHPGTIKVAQRRFIERLFIFQQMLPKLLRRAGAVPCQPVTLHAQRTRKVDRLGVAQAAGEGHQRQPGRQQRQQHDGAQRLGDTAGYGTFNNHGNIPVFGAGIIKERAASCQGHTKYRHVGLQSAQKINSADITQESVRRGV